MKDIKVAAVCNQVGDSQEGFSFPGVAVVLDPASRVIAEYKENKENMALAGR